VILELIKQQCIAQMGRRRNFPLRKGLMLLLLSAHNPDHLRGRSAPPALAIAAEVQGEKEKGESDASKA
jgi:hypothetical protein